MIDPIDDDPEDTGDITTPDLSWPDCPMLPRRDMLAVIERHKDLDGRAVNLFRNALQRPQKSDLFKHYIGPNLYHPGSHYIYTNPDHDRVRHKNWRPEITAKALEYGTIGPCAVFSNTLCSRRSKNPSLKRPGGPVAPE